LSITLISTLNQSGRASGHYFKGFNMTNTEYEIITATIAAYAKSDADNYAHLASAGFEPEPYHNARAVRLNLLATDLARNFHLKDATFDGAKFMKDCGL
jgi:hypothetical protein